MVHRSRPPPSRRHCWPVAWVACLALVAALMLGTPRRVAARELLQNVKYSSNGQTSLTASAAGYQVPQQPVYYVPAAPATTYTQQPRVAAPDTMTPVGPAPMPQQGQQPAASGGGGDPINDPVLQSVLDQHNMYRAAHQVGPLTWSASLAADAQNWAQRCVFQHSGPGECLAMGHASFLLGVNDWYNEVKLYDFAAGQYSPQTGHFTQMVWKASTQLGCGYDPGCKLYVCHYAPYGNVIGQFLENVFPAVRH